MAMPLRKVASYLGLVEDPAGQEDEIYQSYTTEATYLPPRTVAPSVTPTVAPVITPTVTPTPAYVPPVSAVAASREITRITTIHPRNYNDARRIGEDFRENTPVIMNVSDMNDEDARRIVDFAAGLTFGLRGSIEKITKGVFLLSPASVDVGAAARAQLREDPFFNQS